MASTPTETWACDCAEYQAGLPPVLKAWAQAQTTTEVSLAQRVETLEAAAALYEAHTENLIERVYELEQALQPALTRLAAVERATPWKKPAKR